MHSLSSVHHRMFSLLHPLIQMPPHPSYPCGYYSDHNRYHYHNHQPATARRCFPRFTPRRNDARPYPSPPPPPLISDSFFWSANMPPPLDRPVPSFAKVVASSNGSRMRPSTGPPSTSTVPPLAPPAQLPKTTLCDFWRRGEVCRFGGNCWYAHGPAHMRANATDENRALSSDSTNPQSTELPEHEEALDPSMNQFTPEQQQWMYLSQRAQTFLPLAHNILAARFNELCQKAGALTEVSMPGRTCEEIEREQTARACAAAGQRANSLLQLSTAGSYSSGPTTPTESGGWFSFFDDTLKEKAASHLRNIVDNVISDTTEFYLIPFEKEVCTLYRHGQCPFGSSCFFEHPGEEDEGVFSDD